MTARALIARRIVARLSRLDRIQRAGIVAAGLFVLACLSVPVFGFVVLGAAGSYATYQALLAALES